MALQMLDEQVESNFLYCSVNNFLFQIRLYFIEKREDGLDYLNISSTDTVFANGLENIFNAIQSKDPIEVVIFNKRKQKILEAFSSETTKLQLFKTDGEDSVNMEINFKLNKR